MNKKIQSFFNSCLEEYTIFNQINLMNEKNIIRFSKAKGIPLSGVLKGDLSKFINIGWLTSDNEDNLFHPFRIYTFLKAIQLCELPITATSSIDRDSFRKFLEHSVEFLPSLETIAIEVNLADSICCLAILLEPIFWLDITNKTKLKFPYYSNLQEFEERLLPYRNKILAYVKTLDTEIWKSHHEHLRIEAAKLDDNSELYILLRLAPWEKRNNIKGNIGGALWLRHIAEVIRLAFEEVHKVDWLEEHEAFGFWYEGAKTRLYGSERPIKNSLITKPRLAFEFGMHTGSIIRWYVEGETEYQAALYVLPKAALAGIEIINLKGVFKENANAPMRLEDHLKNDRVLRRFSFISFDADKSENIRFLKKHVGQGNIVGYININHPDFEFENFTLDELIEIAIEFDKKLGFDSKTLRMGHKQDCHSGKAFEKYYKEYSIRKISLKGNEWGEALAEYALDNPLREDTKERRTFLKTIDQILRARVVSYDYQRDDFEIDPNDFQIKEKDNPI